VRKKLYSSQETVVVKSSSSQSWEKNVVCEYKDSELSDSQSFVRRVTQKPSDRHRNL